MFDMIFFVYLQKIIRFFMKSLRLFGVFFLLALFSCNVTDNEYNVMNTVLQQAESLYQHPDGERFETESADTLQMLSELIEASKFFISSNDAEKSAKTALFLGYAQKEANDRASAMKEFKKAEHDAEIAGDSLTMARAQFNIAKMLIDEGAYTDAFTIAYIAEQNCGNHNEDKAFVQNLLASLYIMRNDYQNAEHYLNMAISNTNIGNTKRIKQKILNNYSVFYRRQGKYDDAINYIRKNTSENDSIIVLMNLLNIGKVYLYNDQYDSAAYYIQRAFDLSKSVKIKPETNVSIYFSLYYIAKKQGYYQNSLYYHELHENLLKKIKEEEAKKELYSIQRQYDYEALQHKLSLKIIRNQRIILTISFLLLLVSIVVIGLLVRQKRILKENERIRKELNKTKEELQNSLKPEIVEKELSRQLHLIITANNIAKMAFDYKKEWSPLVYKINNEKDNMFEASMIAIERVYPDMYATILRKYPALNETESKVLLLSCSDLTNNEIGCILGLSVHSVNKSRSEINKMINDKNKV